MSFFGDIGRSFVKVFTNPAKANFGDYATAGGLIAGATVGSAYLSGAFASKAAAAPALAAPAAGSLVSPLAVSGPIVADSALIGVGTKAGLASAISAEFTGAGLVAPALVTEASAASLMAPAGLAGVGMAATPGAAAAAAASLPYSIPGMVQAGFGPPTSATFWGSVANGFKAAGSFITKTLQTSVLAAAAIAPWKKAGEAAYSEIYGPGGADPGGGSSSSEGAAGGMLAGDSPAVPAKSQLTFYLGLAAVSVFLALAVWLWRRRKRS